MPHREAMPDWQNGHILNPIFRPLYIPPAEFEVKELPYHNNAHGRATPKYAQAIAKEVMQYGVEIETDVFAMAGRGHDTRFWERPGLDHPFETKEELSADVTDRIAWSLGMPPSKRTVTHGVILASGIHVPCRTDTERCFRQGDLMAGNLLEGPIPFLNTTYRLYQESKILKQEAAFSLRNPTKLIGDMVQFGGISYELMSSLMAPDIEFPDIDYEKLGLQTFAARASRNLNLLGSTQRLTRFLGSHLGEVVQYQPVGV